MELRNKLNSAWVVITYCSGMRLEESFVKGDKWEMGDFVKEVKYYIDYKGFEFEGILEDDDEYRLTMSGGDICFQIVYGYDEETAREIENMF